MEEEVRITTAKSERGTAVIAQKPESPELGDAGVNALTALGEALTDYFQACMDRGEEVERLSIDVPKDSNELPDQES